MPLPGKLNFEWQNARAIVPMLYDCAYCGAGVASELGLHPNAGSSPAAGHPVIAICPHCKNPTYLHSEAQVPAPPIGSRIGFVPQGVDAVYEEARMCTMAGAHTGAVMLCRKLIMHIAVENGADEGKAFAFYVDHLASNHFLPLGGEAWVDQIRTVANEANHEITVKDGSDAQLVIGFAEMLLRFLYEFPARARGPVAQSS